MQVAAFNVFNYFTTMSEDDSQARGAKNEEFFAVQRSKIVSAIDGLDAEVVALMEIENSVHFGDGTADVALADLVEGLNEDAGFGRVGLRPDARRAARDRHRRDHQRDHLPEGCRHPGGRQHGEDRRVGVGQRPRADRAGVRHGRQGRLGRRQPLQIEVGRRRRAGRRSGPLQRGPHRPGGVAAGLHRRDRRGQRQR